MAGSGVAATERRRRATLPREAVPERSRVAAAMRVPRVRVGFVASLSRLS